MGLVIIIIVEVPCKKRMLFIDCHRLVILLKTNDGSEILGADTQFFREFMVQPAAAVSCFLF